MGSPIADLSSFKQNESYIESVQQALYSQIIEYNEAKDSTYRSIYAGIENRWHQVVTTVFPPGTVAILPVNGSALDAVGVSRSSYPWRLNHVHVIQLMTDTVTSLSPGSTSPLGYCGGIVARRIPPHNASPVTLLLDDPECIERRDCSPEVDPLAGAWSPANVGGAVDDWARDQATLSAWRRSGRVACALLYYVNTTKYNVDLMHFDYPAASESRAVTVGGEYRRSYAPRRGLWHLPGSSDDASTSDDIAKGVMGRGGARVSGRRSRGAASQILKHVVGNQSSSSNGSSSPWPNAWPTVRYPSPIMGPFVRYKGIRLDRIMPPDPDASLPPIHRGHWECNDTSLVGAFRFRPTCRAMCDDPGQVAVLPDLEHADNDDCDNCSGNMSQEGWRLSASLSRVWFSDWTGRPELPRCGPCDASGSFRPRSCVPAGLVPMECRDDRRDMSLGMFGSRWSQRESASEARVELVLSFDRNIWPRAQLAYGKGVTVGLHYPAPLAEELDLLRYEVEVDVRDLLGEGNPGARFNSSEAQRRDPSVRQLDV